MNVRFPFAVVHSSQPDAEELLQDAESDAEMEPTEVSGMESGGIQEENNTVMQEESELRRSERTTRSVMSRFMRDKYVFGITGDMADPLTYDGALRSSEAVHWQKTMDDEYQALTKNGTWDLTDIPEDANIIGCKWVFNIYTYLDTWIMWSIRR